MKIEHLGDALRQLAERAPNDGLATELKQNAFTIDHALAEGQLNQIEIARAAATRAYRLITDEV